jgi:hypothetical protein
VEAYQEARKAIGEKHCQRNEHGSPVLNQGNNYVWASREAMILLTNDIRELDEIEFEIPGEKIEADLEELERAGYKPSIQDQIDLEGLVDFVFKEKQ